MSRPFQVLVFISGNGSNLQALIDKQKSLGFCIAGVISSCENAFGLKRAQQAGINTFIVDKKQYPEKYLLDAALIEIIDSVKADLIVLAGFMRILTAEFTQKYRNKIINIHPSLLPKYKGLNTHKRALQAKDQWHGVTIHFVTASLDDGPIIMQASTPILPTDTEDTLRKRIQTLEHEMYPIVVGWFSSKRITCKSSIVFLDNTPFPPNGFQYPILEKGRMIP